MAFTRPRASQIDFDLTNITDPLVRLNSGETGSADKDVGIIIERGDDTNAAIIYDESADTFAFINTSENGTTSGNVTIASYANLVVNTITGSLTGTASANLPLSGGTMSGAIAMGTSKITGVGDPTSAQDASTKAYVDSSVSAIDTTSNASGFTNSTFIVVPGTVNFDLAKQQDQTGAAETPFVAAGLDAFGVSISEIYDMMEPIGKAVTTDLGALS